MPRPDLILLAALAFAAGFLGVFAGPALAAEAAAFAEPLKHLTAILLTVAAWGWVVARFARLAGVLA